MCPTLRATREEFPLAAVIAVLYDDKILILKEPATAESVRARLWRRDRCGGSGGQPHHALATGDDSPTRTLRGPRWAAAAILGRRRRDRCEGGAAERRLAGEWQSFDKTYAARLGAGPE